MKKQIINGVTLAVLLSMLMGLPDKTQAQSQILTLDPPWRDIGIHYNGGVSYDSIASSNIGTDCEATGTNSFAGGYQSYAQDANAFAFGYKSHATNSYAYAMGNWAYAQGNKSIALGFYVRAQHGTSIIIGSGYNSNNSLLSVDAGITMGMGSKKPTLFISKATGSQKTGKVAIGDVSPKAKLHVRSDTSEDAGLILEPGSPTVHNAYVQLRDSLHRITVNSQGEMSISADKLNPIFLSSSNLNVQGTTLQVGDDNSNMFLSAEGTPSLSSNAYQANGQYYSITESPSYTLEFGGSCIRFRTTTNTIPRDRNLINTWDDVLTMKPNGSVILNGKMGVNIENTYSDYALVVDGGILTTKVRIKEVNNWPDYVFGEDYRLIPLGEVEAYVASNRHLPGVPSEAEVRTEGYDVAEMQAVLLRKIEELTLHVIRQQKEIDSLRTLVTVRFGYDACGNRVSRTLEFSKGEPDAVPNGMPIDDADQWQSELRDDFAGGEAALFPNPTDGGFILSLAGEVTKNGITAVVCTLDGKVVDERAVSGSMEAFDLSGKPAGIYLLRLSSDRETKVWKIIKRN